MPALPRRLQLVEPAKKLKDWYDSDLLDDLSARFGGQLPDFDSSRFVRLASDGLENLEMMGRVRQISDAMGACLPGPTSDNMRVLIACMGPPLPRIDDGTGMVGSGYALWPFGEYIGRYGLDDWDASWTAMDELTQRLTSEFAVRPFLAADLERSLSMLEERLQHPNHHVRRWVSEGTRTRLPWAKAVPGLRKVQEQRLQFLETLKDDPSPYVRRSVANHLQDILKDDKERGLEVLEAWASAGSVEVDWVVKHASRGLLKAGDPRVLALYGWDKPLTLEWFRVSSSAVCEGDGVQLAARLINTHPTATPVRVDYLWQGPTPSGRRFGKVFCWTETEVAASAAIELQKSHAFVQRSTRKLPPGDYLFTLLVNGSPLADASVVLA